jgi:hypothetical protein
MFSQPANTLYIVFSYRRPQDRPYEQGMVWTGNFNGSTIIRWVPDTPHSIKIDMDTGWCCRCQEVPYSILNVSYTCDSYNTGP